MDVLTHDTLPSDVEALRHLAMEQSFLIEKLKAQIAVMRRAQFGTRSEHLDQLELMLEEMEVRRAEDPALQPEPSEPKEQPRVKRCRTIWPGTR